MGGAGVLANGQSSSTITAPVVGDGLVDIEKRRGGRIKNGAFTKNISFLQKKCKKLSEQKLGKNVKIEVCLIFL